MYHSPLQTLLPLNNPDLKQFWHVDVTAAIDAWQGHEHDIAAGKEDAAKKFKEWKETREKEIALRKEVGL